MLHYPLLLASYFFNYEVIIDEKLKRWDVGIESRENSYKRAFDYSKKFTCNNHQMMFSLLPLE